MTKRFTFFTALLLMGVMTVLAQGRKITGTVIFAEDNEPVVGAHVEVVGDKIVAKTDVDGNFVLNNVSSASKKVRVSYIGLKTVEVVLKDGMKIILEEDTKQLNDVMVVAFGQAKKEAFTGSASVLGQDQIAAVQTTNVTDALTGQVAGVQTIKSSGRPGEGSSVYIRGIGSYLASNQPLYIVDGSPYAGDIAAINPADIASMTVMKDAAANALYGARGANGVIIITTKKGERGKAQVTLDAKWGTNSKASRDYEVMKNPDMYMQTLYKSFYNNYYDKYSATMTPQQAALQANRDANNNIFSNSGMGVGYQMYYLPAGQMMFGLDGRINPMARMGNVIDGYYYTADDWSKELLGDANLRQEYTATVSGGSEKNDYFISFGYVDDDGLIPGSGLSRFTSRIKNDYRVKDWLRVGENISFTHYKYSDPDGQSGSGESSNVFYVANNIAPIYSLYVRDAKGRIMYDKKGYPIYEYGDRTTSAIDRSFMPGSNPGSDLNLDQNYAYSNILDATAYVEADLGLEGLRARVTYNYFVDDSRINSLTNKYYGQYSYMGGIVSVASQRSTTTNLQSMLTYKNTFAEKHTVDLMAAFERYTSEVASLSGSKNMMYSDDVVELGNALLNPTTTSGKDNYATLGFLMRAQYDYKERYFGSVSYRRDGSSRFSPDHRWGNFWSIGGAWLINRESWFNAKWVNLLKLKASYGEQGNDAIGNSYAWTNQYGIHDINGSTALSQKYIGNPNLTWEASRNFNVGLDFELFNSRLNGTIEWFNRQTDDMLYALPVSLTTGFGTKYENVGSVRNRGIEIDLNGILVDNWKGLTVRLNLNGTSLRNKILKLPKELGGQYISGNFIRKEGGAMYSFYMPKWAGVDPMTGEATWWMDVKDANGNVIGQEKTNNWEKATYYDLGDMMPQVYGGFGLNATWKGLDFTINFSYQWGGKMYDNGYASLMHNGSSGAGQNWHCDILKAWTPENRNTDVPKLTTDASGIYSTAVSDRFLISSNYLSLNNITLGYTLPKNIVSRLHMQNIRIFGQADNISLWSRRDGLDPRRSFTNGSNSEYSLLRTISGGINVTF